MKVAFVNQPWDNVIPPVQGGSLAIWTYQVVRRSTHACDMLVYSRKAPDQRQEETFNNVHYRRISTAIEDQLLKPLKLVERVSSHRIPRLPLFATQLYYRKYISDIAQDIRSQNVNIVHIFNFSQFAPIVRSANPDIKIVLHMQCEWLTQLDKKAIEERLQHVDMIVGCSKYITNKICERFPAYAERCYTVFNGVDAEHFDNGTNDDCAKAPTTQQDNTRRILFVGRVAPEKGVHVLIDSMQHVIEQQPQVELNIVGPVSNTPYEFIVMISDDDNVADLSSIYQHRFRRIDYFSKLQEGLYPQAAAHVNFVGHVSHSELTSYYQSADLLVNPSLSEAFGMSLVEAMASGVPVVASRVGGMTEVVDDGKTGILVDANDTDGLARAILSLLEDDDARLVMGRAGRQRVLDHYTWDSIAQRMIDLYGQLANKCV